MAYGNIFHALGLRMHQPSGSLKSLIDSNENEIQQIVGCYDRVARYAHKFPDISHFHIAFSGILLEQLRNREITDRCRRFMDIPAMLEGYRVAKNIELLGMGYCHPIFPLIPQEDWEDQIIAERQLMEEIFGRAPRGFYPPEMAFSMQMIPALVKAGYEYVVVDSAYIRPHNEPLDTFKPYKAYYDNTSITIIPKDWDISNAQLGGMDVYWFANEISHRARSSHQPEAPRLLTTWSDGENGEWFRQSEEQGGFFGGYLTRYMAHVNSRRYPIKPVTISEFIREYPAETSVYVQTCKWSAEEETQYDLPQWQGSEMQHRAVNKLREVSGRYTRLKAANAPNGATITLKEARRLILEGEASHLLYGGENDLHKLFDYMNAAEELLAKVEKSAAKQPTPPAKIEVKTTTAPPAVTEPAKVESVEKTTTKPVTSPQTEEKTATFATVAPAESNAKSPTIPTATSTNQDEKKEPVVVATPPSKAATSQSQETSVTSRTESSVKTTGSPTASPEPKSSTPATSVKVETFAPTAKSPAATGKEELNSPKTDKAKPTQF